MLNLPLELITEILRYLTNTQVMLLRKCNKKLQEHVGIRPIIFKINDFKCSRELLVWSKLNGSVWGDISVDQLKSFPMYEYRLGIVSFRAIMYRDNQEIRNLFLTTDYFTSKYGNLEIVRWLRQRYQLSTHIAFELCGEICDWHLTNGEGITRHSADIIEWFITIIKGTAGSAIHGGSVDKIEMLVRNSGTELMGTLD